MLRLEIEDNGTGFPFEGSYDVEQCTTTGRGPRSLAWRTKALSGTLRAGAGTHGAKVTIEVPISPEPARNAA